MKAEKITLLTGCVLIVLLAVFIVWQAGVVGGFAGKMGEGGREKQGI